MVSREQLFGHASRNRRQDTAVARQPVHQCAETIKTHPSCAHRELNFTTVRAPKENAKSVSGTKVPLFSDGAFSTVATQSRAISSRTRSALPTVHGSPSNRQFMRGKKPSRWPNSAANN